MKGIQNILRKYKNIKLEQEKFKAITPLDNAFQHGLLDQNIYLIGSFIFDLEKLEVVND